MRPDEAQIFRRGNDMIVVSSRCRRCGGNRLWVDFTGELQCIDCDPPQKVYKEKLEAAKLRKAVREAQLEKFEDSEREDAEREAHKPKLIIIP